jgi:pyruvate formate-lyase activating enzyme-like uncharacterized protein
MREMTRAIGQIAGDSLFIGRLPMGCRLCAKGSKMVLFVTGLCDSSCYYCPLSVEKAGKDVIFADEVPVTSDADIISEVDAIGAKGSGFSGGDPLCKLERTLHYLRLLKSAREADFHIHLYTSKCSADRESLKRLMDAGLDEIRFHPQTSDWAGVETAVRIGMNVGLEVPAIPGTAERLQALAVRAEETGVSFVNINELEASESNFQRMASLGMRLTSMDASSVAGSKETAVEVLEWGAKNLSKLSLHYCSARFKDAVQMRNRLERRLKRTRRAFEERDDADPLLILGIIRAPHGQRLDMRALESLQDTLESQFDVPSNLVNLDNARMRIEIAPWILGEIAGELRKLLDLNPEIEMGIAFEYPSWDRLQTLFNPL